MTRLTIGLAPTVAAPAGTAVAGEVIDTADTRIARLVVVAGGCADVDVPPGRHIVRLEFPSGVIGDAFVEVGEREPVTLNLMPATAGSPARRGLLSRLVAWVRRAVGRRRAVPAVLWTARPDGTWKRSSELRLSRSHATPVPLGDAGPHVLAYAERDGGSEIVALPSASSATVRFEAKGATASTVPEVRLAGALAETLSGYLETNRLAPAAGLIDQVMEEPATRMVGDRALETVVGYHLLRRGDHGRLATWRRLERSGTELPDQLVVAAWSLMDEGDTVGGRERLLRAANHGPPAYGEGLRLLRDGLDLFASSEGYDPDGRAAAALANVMPYAADLTLDQPFTAFRGTHPGEPEPAAVPRPETAWVRPAKGIELSLSERHLRGLLIAHAIWSGVLGIAYLIQGDTTVLGELPNSFALSTFFVVLSAVGAADVRRFGWLSLLIATGYLGLVIGQLAVLMWGGAPDVEALVFEVPTTAALVAWMAVDLLLVVVFAALASAADRAAKELCFLHPLAFRCLVALAEVLVDTGADTLSPDIVARNVDAYLDRTRGAGRARVQLALVVLTVWPMLGGRLPLPMMNAEQRRRFLEHRFPASANQRGAFRPLRATVQVLIRTAVQLTYLGFYGDPRSWPSIGFTPTATPRRQSESQFRSLPVPPRGGRGGYDAIIVGSGAAGAVLAYRFAEAGRRVLVLERGAHVDPTALGADEVGRYLSLYREGGLALATDFSLMVLQGVCVGGGTTVTHGLGLEPPEPVLESWAERGIDRAGFAACIGEVRRWLDMRPLESGAETIAARRFASGIEQLGLTGRLDGLTGALTVLDSVLPWAQRAFPGQIELLADCGVNAIIHNGDRALAVAGLHRGRERVLLPADEVVIAAGSIASSWLLQRSGIGGDAAGRGLFFDLGATLIADFAEPVDAFDSVQLAQAYVPGPGIPGFVVETWFNPPAGQALVMPGWFERHTENMRRYRHMAATTVHVGTTTPGRIRPSRHGPVIEYTPSTADLARIGDGLETAAQIFLAAGAQRVMPSTFDWHELRTPSEAGELAERVHMAGDRFMMSAHPLGGNAVGDVVDEGFRVKGFRNLYLCDASVLPTGVHVPPQLTVMAMAQYAAGEILVNA